MKDEGTVLHRILLHARKNELYQKLLRPFWQLNRHAGIVRGSAGIGEAVDIKIVHVFHEYTNGESASTSARPYARPLRVSLLWVMVGVGLGLGLGLGLRLV